MTSTSRAFRALSAGAMLVAGMGAVVVMTTAPIAAHAAETRQGLRSPVQAAIANEAGDLDRFYRAREYQPLWLMNDGTAGEAARALLHRLETAQFDGLDERTVKRFQTRSIRRDLDRAADGRASAIAKADVRLSELFANYVRAVRAAPRSDMILESRVLAPVVPTPVSALSAADKAPSLATYIKDMGWMHPFYAPLRDAMEAATFSADERRIIWTNLDRIRALPATPAERYVLVDAASARLWMYENGKPVDTMKVVVGTPETPTPPMAGFIRYAIFNPYWNVPPDMVQGKIAQRVIKGGTRYLRQGGYEVLSGYDADAEILDPAAVDWKSVAAGAPPPHVRQKPGGSNFMGKVKYEFPNAQGIYLHDTPERALLKKEDRQFSNGCVRLEDADRFGKWLLGQSRFKTTAKPEQRVDLPTVVPVYITYLTAFPTAKGIAFRDDVYGRDARMRFAQND
ncbi:L,D-transpeptidase family protein [Altererythrobacter aerius]|uniref:L,D-transpeptidase family protein n=1 Tax=Tsuneonella aeria TaxID=1837929 RepID=A0A6I4THK8_9SPHN|nr:L,D-transpeptidase family protein [Tsuneonella aeria]MXO76114.1 L,D-transpeptidase family protein [Tsuneonella aeria]